jgi:hypothetical protein
VMGHGCQLITERLRPGNCINAAHTWSESWKRQRQAYLCKEPTEFPLGPSVCVHDLLFVQLVSLPPSAAPAAPSDTLIAQRFDCVARHTPASAAPNPKQPPRHREERDLGKIGGNLDRLVQGALLLPWVLLHQTTAHNVNNKWHKQIPDQTQSNAAHTEKTTSK